MGEIKASGSGLSGIQGSLRKAGGKLPDKATLQDGASTGDGYNEFKRQLKAIEKLVKSYKSVLDRDIDAVGKVGKTLEAADKAAGGAFEGGQS